MTNEPEIVIEPAVGTWSVRAQGAIIGGSSRALLLREKGHDPVLYIPREDLQMVFFDRSEKSTHCPHKGDATYFHLIGKNRRQDDVAWSYETPFDGAAQIAGHLAFNKGSVTIEAVS